MTVIEQTARAARYRALAQNVIAAQAATAKMLRERHLSVTESSAALAVDTATIRRWIKSGHLRASRVGVLGHWRVPASEIRRLRGE